MIDRFSMERFEAALPVNKATGEPLWSRFGFFGSERLYGMKVSENVMIWIYSSMDSSGFAANTGENSIRCFLGTADNTQPLSNKSQTYITRVKGWEGRLETMLRMLYKLGLEITPKCTICGCQMSAFWCKTGKPENLGRRFKKCMTCNNGFQWLDAPKEVKVKAPKEDSGICEHNMMRGDCDRCWGNKFAQLEAQQENEAFRLKMLRDSGGLG